MLANADHGSPEIAQALSVQCKRGPDLMRAWYETAPFLVQERNKARGMIL